MPFNSPKKYDRPILKLNQPDDSHKIQPLPAPSGNYPYHLALEKFANVPDEGFSFHMVGDTGGIHYPEGQQKIAQQLHKQIMEAEPEEKPAFLYHLGDIVYHHGEAEHYERQFFKPYAAYPAPVFAIAGNHDSDINPGNPVPYKSLDAFAAVFCSAQSCEVPFSEGRRKSMVQPNVYWTLQTPLANIIGLHSNVPKFGYIDDEQKAWFIEELKTAANERPGKCIIVCVHHAPYTADENHGSSLYMINFLEDAFTQSGVRPDIVFSGHVHNYQRFNKTYTDGTVLPFVVCGAGGFDELHDLVTVGDPHYSPDSELLDNVRLENATVMKHGFLKVTLARRDGGVALSGEYFVLPDSNATAPLLMDSFEYYCLG